jgi:hypothetical protein
MASTQVSFEEISQIWAAACFWNFTGEVIYRGDRMFTFEQITQIEIKRRVIQDLQRLLTQQTDHAKFAYKNGVSWIELSLEANAVVREVVLKLTAVKIVELLDECEHLGVDVMEGRTTVAKFLADLKMEKQ